MAQNGSGPNLGYLGKLAELGGLLTQGSLTETVEKIQRSLKTMGPMWTAPYLGKLPELGGLLFHQQTTPTSDLYPTKPTSPTLSQAHRSAPGRWAWSRRGRGNANISPVVQLSPARIWRVRQSKWIRRASHGTEPALTLLWCKLPWRTRRLTRWATTSNKGVIFETGLDEIVFSLQGCCKVSTRASAFLATQTSVWQALLTMCLYKAASLTFIVQHRDPWT